MSVETLKGEKNYGKYTHIRKKDAWNYRRI